MLHAASCEMNEMLMSIEPLSLQMMVVVVVIVIVVFTRCRCHCLSSPTSATSRVTCRYVLDNSYTVQRLNPDTKTMTPLFAIPQGPGLAVYRSSLCLTHAH